MPPIIALGADHGGFETKQKLIAKLKAAGTRIIDMGTHGKEASDYPIFARRVAEAVASGRAGLGVLVCRSGNGMAMAANKVYGVRAAIAESAELALLARQHNDANVLVIGQDYLQDDCAKILDAFLQSKPEDGRHARRVGLIRDQDLLAASGLPTRRLAAFGQSPWLDDISDKLIASGELRRWVEERGVRGVTSNPSIFEKAINSGEGRYLGQLAKLKTEGKSAEEAYEILTTEDIGAAADILRPLYDATGGDDGFVSLEVLPSLAHDEETTVKDAERLFKQLARPNIMIKVPGTVEGIRAFRRLTALGVNVNVTLIFSRKFYNDIARAYVAGLSDRLAAGKDVSGVRSVASVFVSRIDGVADKKLAELKAAEKDEAKLRLIDAATNAVAIANTKLIYQDFKTIFYGEEFAKLAEAGAAPQRPLWGSTGTKDPKLSDVLYVEELVGAMTVNTIPTATLKAFLDHGRVRGATVEEDIAGASAIIDSLPKLGIDLEAVCMDLQKAGVKSFAEAFDTLFAAIKKALG